MSNKHGLRAKLLSESSSFLRKFNVLYLYSPLARRSKKHMPVPVDGKRKSAQLEADELYSGSSDESPVVGLVFLMEN